MENEIVKLDGYFVYTIYSSNNYMVSKFETPDGVITVTGPFIDYDKEAKYTISGTYVDHPKYGFQFQMMSISKYIPSQKDEVVKFLSSSLFKGIGKKAAEKIYLKFGENSLEILRHEPERLFELDITAKQYDALISGLNSLNEENDNDTLFMLLTAGFNNNEAMHIINTFHDDAIFIMQDNPYRFYLDVKMMPFNVVCNVAKKIEVDNKEQKYKEAMLVYLFKDYSFKTGNTYLSYEELTKVYGRYYNDLDDILFICLRDEYLIKDDEKYYYVDDFKDEKTIVDFLNSPREQLNDYSNEIAELLSDDSDLSIVYDPYQKKAIQTFFEKDFSIIIGGPGTGKTTLIKAIVSLFRDYYPYHNMIVLAPTGRAAKRISEICDVESKTIHSALRWNKEENIFTHNKDNPIIYDAIIIDEFSMVDNNLFASLLNAAQYAKKICVIGDDQQLPSIRQGNLLKDLVDSRLFPLTYLKENHRQRAGNEIISLANKIAAKDLSLYEYKNDIRYFDINNFDYEKLVKAIKEDIENGISLDEILILSPMYRGNFGIDNLNVYLQKAFNPPSFSKKEHKVGNMVFRENDKILQLKNRPNDDVYNGDIGILEEIDEDQKCLVVNYQGVYVFYNYDDVKDITLAYALSVHKAQGSEYKVIYFIVSKQHINMLYQKLIYTAVTRAKEKLVIIADNEVLDNGIKRQLSDRKTGLLSKLKKDYVIIDE